MTLYRGVNSREIQVAYCCTSPIDKHNRTFGRYVDVGVAGQIRI